MAAIAGSSTKVQTSLFLLTKLARGRPTDDAHFARPAAHHCEIWISDRSGVAVKRTIARTCKQSVGLRYSVKRIVQSGGGGEILRRVERPEQVLFTSTSLVLAPSSDLCNKRLCGF